MGNIRSNKNKGDIRLTIWTSIRTRIRITNTFRTVTVRTQIIAKKDANYDKNYVESPTFSSCYSFFNWPYLPPKN